MRAPRTHHLRFGMSKGKFFRSVQSVDNEPLRPFLIETAGVVGSRPHLATQLPTQRCGHVSRALPWKADSRARK